MSAGASFLAGAQVAEDRVRMQAEAAKRKAAADTASNAPADRVSADLETPLSFGQNASVSASVPVGPLGAVEPATPNAGYAQPQTPSPEQMPAAQPVASTFSIKDMIADDDDVRFANGYAQRLRKLGFAEDAIKVQKDAYDLAEKKALIDINNMNRGVDLIKSGATKQGLQLINGMRRERDDPVFIAAYSQPLTTSEYGKLKTIFGNVPIPNLPRDGSIVAMLDNQGNWQYINSDQLKAAATPAKEQYQEKARWDTEVMKGLLDMYKSTISAKGNKDTLNDLIKRLLERQISADRTMQKENLTPEQLAQKYPQLTFADAEANILQKWYTNMTQQAAAAGLQASLPGMLGMMENDPQANIAAIQQFAASQAAERTKTMPGIVVPKGKADTKSTETKYKVKTKGGKEQVVTESQLRAALKKQGVKDIEAALKRTPKAD